MCQLLETIKCKNGQLFNLRFHRNRFNIARKEILGIKSEITLEQNIKIPEQCKTGLFRCRVTYSVNIEKIEFIHHKYRQVRSLRLVENNSLEYRYKFADRRDLEMLFSQRGNCDDILIVKNGCITDSYTANAVFFDGLKWWTPDSPLLAGTSRAKLLSEGKIFVCRITPPDLYKYQKAGLINAMQDMEDMPIIDIDKIKW